MNKFSKEEIELCKEISSFFRKPIGFADWFLLDDYSTIPKVWIEEFQAPLIHPPLGERYVPLWTWQNARDWLREKGWEFKDLIVKNKMTPNTAYKMSYISCENFRKTHGFEINKFGNTDPEAILKVIVQILKEEK